MVEIELYRLMETKYLLYNTKEFIETDPISIPHKFGRSEDIEIAGFLAATISWGQRTTIIKNGVRLLNLMDDAPYEFIIGFGERELSRFDKFVHRTFNYADLSTFLFALKNIYQTHGGLENVFSRGLKKGNMDVAIAHFREVFFEVPHDHRTRKHVSNPLSGATAKRINMFLRWMVRADDKGVDFGIWKNINASQLYCPLDVHSARVARKLGLLERTQNDWKAVEELTMQLKKLDPHDPVKYDFALFGMGVFEKF